MRKPIEFEQNNPNLISALTPSHQEPFEDLLLKPQYSNRKYTLPRGTSTFRLLPVLKGCSHWMAPIASQDHGNGRHPNPKTTQTIATSVFDIARDWLGKNQPDALYRKNNPSGHKLWTTQLAACWIVVEGPEPPELRILIASGFPGSKQGAKAGLAYRLQELVRQNPSVLDPESAHQIKLTRSYGAGSKYPETQLMLNQTSTPLKHLLGELSDEDLKLVCPITDTIRQIDTEHEWFLLAKAIGQELVNKIRTDTAQI